MPVIDTEVLGIMRNYPGQNLFTNGVFDLYHAGHVALLSAIGAKYPSVRVIVGVNSDASTTRLKGQGRPIIPQDERMAIVLSHKAVHFVVLMEDDTPELLIKILRPGILVKGGDYLNTGPIVGQGFVEAYGGIVDILPYKDGEWTNTSKIMNRIQKRSAP